MAWILMGGGCLIAGNSKFPCDDTFRNEKTGKEIWVRTTIDRHFSMPSKVRSLSQIYKLSGVKAPKKK